MADLSQMLAALQDEAKAQQAQITAGEIKLRALKSAHQDELDALAKTRKEAATLKARIDHVHSCCEKMIEVAENTVDGIFNKVSALGNRKT